MNHINQKYSTDEKIVAGVFITMAVMIMVLMHVVNVLLKLSLACST